MTGVTAVLGYGRFGRALSELALDAGLPVRAWDPEAEIPEALRALSRDDLVRGAERVVLSVPVGAIRSAALALRPRLAPSQIVIDVASVKALPVRDLTETLGVAIPWVATHPLFGATSIALGERPLTTVVCPNPLHPDAARRAREFWEALGCHVVELEPNEHDRVMAHTHALAFFVAKGFIDIGAGDTLPFAPPSFQAIARTIEAVRSDASHLFRTIQSDNPFSAGARAELLAALEDIHRRLESEPREAAPSDRPPDIPDMGDSAPDLRETRDLIDDLDREIVALFARRAQLARRAGRAKALEGRPVRDPAREREVIEARRSWAEQQGLDADAVAEIFRRIVRSSRAVQREPGEERAP